jgi:hypothetical protein
VIPVEHHVDAELLGLGNGTPEVGVLGVLWLQLNADADGVGGVRAGG